MQLLKDVLSVNFMQQEQKDSLNKLEIQKDKELKDLEREFQNIGRGLLDGKRKKEIHNRIIELKHELEKIKFRTELKTKVKEQIEKAKAPLHIIANKYNDLKKQIDDHEKDQERINGIDEQFSKLENKILNMYDKSKIVAYFKNEELYFLILDTGNTKTAFGYLKMISELKMLYNFNKINIFVVSYSENRAKNLLKEFNDTQSEKNKALKVMTAYEKNTGVDRKNRNSWKYAPTFYISAENIYYNTPEINICNYSKKTIILEAYKKNLSMSENYIRNKDKKSIAELKEKFKV